MAQALARITPFLLALHTNIAADVAKLGLYCAHTQGTPEPVQAIYRLNTRRPMAASAQILIFEPEPFHCPEEISLGLSFKQRIHIHTTARQISLTDTYIDSLAQ